MNSNKITGYLSKTGKSPYYQMIISINGKEQQKTTKRKKKCEAKEVLAETLNKLQKQYAAGVAEPSKELLFDYIDRWVETIDVKATTRDSYRIYIKNHVKRFCKLNIHISEIRPTLVREYIRFLRNQKTNKGTLLKPKTIKSAYCILSQCLECAYRDEDIVSNPCKKTTCPKADITEQPVLAESEFKHLIEFVKGTDDALIIHLFCFGAIRRGEAAGLKFSDFDYDECSCRITRSRTKITKEYEAEPKTKDSIRTIYYPKFVIEELKQEQEKHRKLKELLGDEYSDNDYVLKTEFGKPYAVGRITKKVKKILPKAGLPPLSPHRLRSSVATVMLNSEGNEFSLSDISKLLGHSNTLITQAYYARYQQESRKRTAKRLEELVAG